MKPLLNPAFFSIFVLLSGAVGLQAQLEVYLSQPGQHWANASDFKGVSSTPSDVNGFKVERFEGGVPAGNSVNGGVYTAVFDGPNSGGYRDGIIANDNYGGARGSEPGAGAQTNGNYVAITASAATKDAGEGPWASSLNITFADPIHYFGFLWTAGNPGNRVVFYDQNDVYLAHFDAADLVSWLGGERRENVPAGKSIESVDGQQIPVIDYYELLNGTFNNRSESSAFLHIINRSGTGIGRVEMLHTSAGLNGSDPLPQANFYGRFESDNHTTLNFAPEVAENASLVHFTDLPTPIPEPSTVVLLGVMGVGAVLLRRRNRRA